MPPRAHLLTATAAAFASLAAATGVASADTYCVAKPACAAKPGGHAAADLPAALAAAAAHGGPDRVEIGAGTFPFPAGGTPVVQSGNDVTEIVGAGRDATILTGGPDDNFALEVEHPGTVVSDLGFALPAGLDSRGINLDAAGAVGRRLDVEGPKANGGSFGVTIDAGAKLEDARIVLPTDVAACGVYVYGNGGATLDGVSITAGYALRVNSTNGTTTVTRAHVRAGYIGAYIQTPNELAIEDSRLESLNGSYHAVGVETGSPGTTTTARITRSTLVSPGSTPLVNLASFTAGATAKAILRGVAVVGPGTPFGRGQTVGTTSFDVDRSAFGPGYATKPADVFGTHNLGAPSGFVDPAAGDYRLRFDSPLVDAGSAVLPGGALDLDGGKRAVDGKGDGSTQPDIGAFEYQRRAPAFEASASAGAAPVGTPIAFLMSNVSDPDPGETPTLRWDFSDGTSAAGAAVQHAFGAAPGGITATAVATDPAGVTTSKALHAEIVPTASGTPNGGTAPGTGGSAPGTGTTGAGGPATPGNASSSVLRVGAPRLGADGRVRVRVTCAGTQHCQGKVALRATKGKKHVALASKVFALKAGGTKTLVVTLGKKARAALPKGRRVRVTATATGRDGAGRALAAVSAKGTLKRR